jgi:hypothetical protein
LWNLRFVSRKLSEVLHVIDTADKPRKASDIKKGGGLSSPYNPARVQ